MNPARLRLTFLVAGFSAAATWGGRAGAQNVPVVVERPVAVGAITRDVGLYTGPADLATMKGVNRYLTLLESDLAEQVSNLDGVRYQDRTSVRELMQELHLSSGSNFDPTSGALRGLMGRLDYLIVIDALDPATAKMRLIDIQTGSVRGVTTCSKRVSGNPECVNAMTHRIEAVGRAREGTAGDLVAARQQVMTAKPAWDDQVARYDATRAFWSRIQNQLAPNGQALRPEIQTLLNGAGTDVQTGRYAIEHLDLSTLKAATLTLGKKLDKLDEAR